MNRIVRTAAALVSVTMNRSIEIVQAVYTQSREQAQVRYIVLRLKRGAVKASAVPQTRPQHAVPTFILDLVTESLMLTMSSKSLR
jgi:hypothetical protein